MLGILNDTIHHRDGEGDGIEVGNMEENEPNIIENEGIIRLIHDTFIAMDENGLVDEIYEDIHDVLPIDKAQKPVYKDSMKSLLYVVFIVG